MPENKKILYRGKIINLYVENVTLPNGARVEFEIVEHPGGAAVVALDEHNRVCLLRQYRHVMQGWMWELPAGKLDRGEPPLTTAKRELEEEAGLRAIHWISLGKMISSPGVFTEIVYLYLAQNLEHVPVNTETHELIEVHWIPFQGALTMASTDEITDAKTLAGLFRAGQKIT
ncbi:MAG TPA: NUDIX hydrolase [Sulfuricaulis sp.]|jgi:ADP-ribose pyrophosphatase|nr:NUDIX hydrolase [Sulfuricaulis sp.]